jgi:hypothetical protein
MIVFSVVCAFLILVGLGFILRPLRHPNRLRAVRTMAEACIVAKSPNWNRIFITDSLQVRSSSEIVKNLKDAPLWICPRRREMSEMSNELSDQARWSSASPLACPWPR